MSPYNLYEKFWLSSTPRVFEGVFMLQKGDLFWRPDRLDETFICTGNSYGAVSYMSFNGLLKHMECKRFFEEDEVNSFIVLRDGIIYLPEGFLTA